MKNIQYSESYIGDILNRYNYCLYKINNSLYNLYGYNNLTKKYFLESSFHNLESAEDYIMTEIAT